jgi:hypothetical protein
VPLQVSTVSQPPTAERQTAVLLPSTGQAAAAPVQFSAGSQTPEDVRHCVVELVKPFAGQVAEVPVQDSAGSQTPAESRHCVEVETKLLAGQLVELPSHVSATSHTPPDRRHVVPAGAMQLSAVSLHTLLQGVPPAHGSPACTLHVVLRHESAPLQNRPSSHDTVFLVESHLSCASLQLSSVHTLPSLQLRSGPAAHEPPLHVSLTVQNLPSSQGAALFGCRHAPEMSQTSSVHGLPSSVHGSPGFF